MRKLLPNRKKSGINSCKQQVKYCGFHRNIKVLKVKHVNINCVFNFLCEFAGFVCVETDIEKLENAEKWLKNMGNTELLEMDTFKRTHFYKMFEKEYLVWERICDEEKGANLFDVFL